MQDGESLLPLKLMLLCTPNQTETQLVDIYRLIENELHAQQVHAN